MYFNSETEIVVRAGKALAQIHRSLQLPDDMVNELPVELQSDRVENVFIHGDFNLLNLLYSEQHNTLAIIDWSTSGHCGGKQ